MNPNTEIPARFAPRSATRSFALGVIGAIALLAGCSSEPDSHVVSSPPPPAPGTQPVTVTTQSTTTTTQPQPVNTIVVTQAPPAAQTEVVLAQPSPDYVWIAGFWTWRDSRYEWMAGHWELPPHSGAVWVAPRWEPENGSFRFYEGYWD
jgi:WXXGXW repeat (2 copies)